MSTAELSPAGLRTQAQSELSRAESAWTEGNAGMSRVCCRRAAGMVIRAWLAEAPRPGYGTNFMHHLRGLADDASHPAGAREAAWRLAARPKPEAGWAVPIGPTLTPMDDARAVIDYLATS